MATYKKRFKKKTTKTVPYPKLSLFEFILALIIGIGLQYLSYFSISEELLIKLVGFDLLDYFKVTLVTLCICSIATYFIMTRVLIWSYTLIFLLFFLNINFFAIYQDIRTGVNSRNLEAGMYLFSLGASLFFPLISGEIGARQIKRKNGGKLRTKDYLEHGQIFTKWESDNVVIRDTSMASWLQLSIVSCWTVTFIILIVVCYQL